MFRVIWMMVVWGGLAWLLFTWPLQALIGLAVLVGCVWVVELWRLDREDQRYIDMQFPGRQCRKRGR